MTAQAALNGCVRVIDCEKRCEIGTDDNIGYPPAGTSAMTMISLYLKNATQAQIPLTSPATR